MLDQQYQKKLRLDSDHMLGNCQLRLTQLLPKLLAAILPQIMLALGKTIPLPSAKLGQCLGSRILFKKIQRRLRFQIRKDLQGPRVILFESYPNLIEQPRFLTHQPMLIAAEHFELLGLLRAGLKRPQMPMIGPEKFCQYIGIKRIALRRAHAKSVPGPIHGLRVDRIDHHSVIQKKIHNPPLWLFNGRPKLAPLGPAFIKPAAKLRQLLHRLTYLLLGYFLALSITDPYLMKLIRPIHSQMISLHFSFLLRCVVPIPSASNGQFALYRSSGGQVSIAPQLRSLAGRDSLRLIFSRSD